MAAPRRREHADVPLDLREQLGGPDEPLRQRRVPVGPRQHLREHQHRGERLAEERQLLQRSAQLGGGRPRRHEDRRIPGPPRIARTCQGGDRLLKALETGSPEQARAAGCDHMECWQPVAKPRACARTIASVVAPPTGVKRVERAPACANPCVKVVETLCNSCGERHIEIFTAPVPGGDRRRCRLLTRSSRRASLDGRSQATRIP